MTAATQSSIDISVIVPLVFVRGPTKRAIESWTQRQSLDHQRYEVIVMSPGDSSGTEQLIKGFLRPFDKLVRANTRNLYGLYDTGIKHSRGRIVMITESHVVATRNCLRNTVEFLDGTGNEAVCCNALSPRNEGYLATMEAMLFQEESRQWIPEGSWRRVHERGFAIFRETYDRSGGFPHEYGWFAGRAFAARIHEAGVPVAYAPKIRVVHFNSVRTKDIVEGARSFVFGELRCREIEPDAHVNRYFGYSNALADRALYSRTLTHTALRDRAARAGRRGWFHYLRAAPSISYLVFRSIFGISLPVAAARLQVYAARARVAVLRPWGPSAGLEAYREYWHQRLVRRFQLEYCRDEASPVEKPGPTSIRAEDVQYLLTGFYPIEDLGGERVRWTNSFAAVRVGVPQKAKRIRVETASISNPLEQRGLALYLNGTKLPLEFGQPYVVSAALDLTTNGIWAATLVLTCDPLPTLDDFRELGILFKAVDVITT